MANGSDAIERRFTVDGCELRYVEWPSDAPALVLIPGSGGMAASPRSWRRFAALMSGSRRVLVLTMRGHAGSAWVQPYTLQRFVDDIAAFIESLGTDVDVVGHSSGAQWSWAYASRPRPRLRRLVLVDPVIPPRGPDTRPELLRERTWPSRQAIVDELRTRWRVDDRANEDFVAGIEDGTHLLPDGTWTWRMDPAFHEATRRGEAWAGIDLSDRAVAAPTLVVLRDGHPQEAELRQALPRARFVTIPNAHHVVHLSTPEPFERLAREFLLG